MLLPSGSGNISFSLAVSLHAWPYAGDSQVPGYTRCAYTYGPLLLAVQGPWNATAGAQAAGDSSDLTAKCGRTVCEKVAQEGTDGGFIVLAGLDPASPSLWASRRPGGSLVFDINSEGPGAGYTLVPYFDIQVGGCAQGVLC